MLEKHRDDVAQHYGRQQATTEKTAEELKSLLQANTDLTQEDKELTEEVAKLTREIHAQLGRASG